MITNPRINAPRQAVTPIRINRSSPYARGLIAWYPASDAQSWGNGYTLYDHSGYHQNGTAASELSPYPLGWTGSGWVSDPPGGLNSGAAPGCQLNNVAIDVSTSGGPLQTLNGPMSFSAWVIVKTAGTVFSQYLSDSNHELIKMVNVETNDMRIILSTSSGGYQEKVFYHPLGLYDWNFIGGSIGGDLSGGSGFLVANEASTTFTCSAFSSTPDTSIPVVIGGKATASGTQGSWKGIFRDLRVWNRPLSLAEMRRLFVETGGRMTGAGYPGFADGGPFQPRGYGSLAQQYRPIPRAAEAVETTAQSAPIFLATTQAGL